MDSIEKKIIDLIDSNREAVIDFARDIYANAELGYKEHRTAEKFAAFLRDLHLEVREGLAITGVKGYLKGNRHDIVLSLIGELDALRIPDHPYANPETQAAHCCGHHAQLAGVVGAAVALSDEEVSRALGGDIVFFAVPAEEYGEIDFKNRLKEEGKILFGGGKSELIRIGAFDDIDLSIVHHLYPGGGIHVGSGTSNGFVSKVIRYIGREAHAAAQPEQGINALNAASLGLSALAYHRETFARALVEELGEDAARPLIQKAVFQLALDRSGRLREKAEEQGLKCDSVESFMKVIDVPFLGWVKELGRDHCPYAEVWRQYFDDYPWFKQIAPFYCDVIDTTNAENFTRCLSHRITQNVLISGESCEREYFESEAVKKGVYSYGEKPEEA
ncbi:MAG: hypothetical protein ACOX88_07740 [Christensenellales bacterium]